MTAPRSIRTALLGDWLVVIGRGEASVFRSMASGAASQCIRAHLPEAGAGMRPLLKLCPNGKERVRPAGFFEPLAAVLHGARRIVVFFGRTTPLGDEPASFVIWLRDRHPEVANRIIASVPIERDELSDARLLAKARTCFQRTAITGPRGAADLACAAGWSAKL